MFIGRMDSACSLRPTLIIDPSCDCLLCLPTFLDGLSIYFSIAQSASQFSQVPHMAKSAVYRANSTSSLLHKLLNVISHSRLASFAAETTIMPPTVGPDSVSVPSLTPYGRSAPPLRRVATSSSQSLDVTVRTSPAYSASSVSIPFEEGDVDVVRLEGLRHSSRRLEARRYKAAAFAEDLLDILHSVRTPSWTNPDITPPKIKIQKVSGSLTNAVFFVSCPSVPSTRILLLRIYGPSSGSLISRPRELHTLHVLSSRYRIAPRVYGTFENGRVEEYFDSTTLTKTDLRDRKISSWIGARMAELHGVDIDAMEATAPARDGARDECTLAAKQNVRSWLGFAREVLAYPTAPDSVRAALDLDTFEKEWAKYTQWLHENEARAGASRRVFSHNDAQYGNLLRLKTLKDGLPEHRQVIVVDFEYAAPNAAAFDIANHFHEWTADYHSSTPHILDPAKYPTREERRNFYRAYLTQVALSGALSPSPAPTKLSDAKMEDEMRKLDDQVRAWSPASHAMWAVWGVVQAREFVEGKDGEPEFDYLGYAQCRMRGFRREIRELGCV
ncbi:kinase-like protein [Amylocystis lapponica]|nr:kinase-like protein [Amylocystis lapponica]